jgi:uncharacterized protein
MSFLLAALSIGFLGSFHCIGMCGPIAMALPLGRESRLKQITGALIYNVGRMITYGLLGLLFGLLGKGFVIGGFQQVLSISLGLLILLGLFLPSKLTARFALMRFIGPLVIKAKSTLGKLLRQKNFNSLFLIGILNGLLPCGLVYLGVAGAIATGDSIKGSLFMLTFGAATVPAMLFVSLASNTIGVKSRIIMRKAVPVFAGAMAFILILRGLNLDIPYISPELSKTDCTQHSCCHKK